MLGLPESPMFLLMQGKKEKAFSILQSIYAMNSGKEAKDYPVSLHYLNQCVRVFIMCFVKILS